MHYRFAGRRCAFATKREAAEINKNQGRKQWKQGWEQMGGAGAGVDEVDEQTALDFAVALASLLTTD